MTKNKRILVISDSLALPRSKPEVTLYEDTYPYLLKNDYEVLQISFGGGTIKEIVHQSHYYLSYNPDYIVLQAGIVDCAYRAFPVFVDKGAVYSKFLDFYRRALAKLVPPHLLRKVFKFRYTKPSDFRNSLLLLKKEYPKATIIAIGIVPASCEYEKHVPGIRNSIILYNEIVKEVIGRYFIDLSELNPECVMSDFHHINRKGHKYIYQRINDFLEHN